MDYVAYIQADLNGYPGYQKLISVSYTHLQKMNWETIYLHLKKNGLDVYSLGQHQGKCLTPYLVLRDNGKTRRRGIEKTEFEVLLYYPADHYSEF